ncbi:energy transducer TonB [Vibrio metoecus]|uniref:Energy transducer TonB n=1 Tax=Vibrio metoecus TaxID=1481663 RepID=A0A0Q0KJX0_VIBMT|nr:energy transducer TonB [Vibrio metoecus]
MQSSLDQAQAIQNSTNQASAQSQQRIDRSAEKTLVLRAEIEQLNEEVKNLQTYRNHLQSLVANQEQEMSSLEQQTEEIKRTRQGTVPLMYDMIDGLEEWVAQDKPIRLAARQERIAKLKELMPRADVSDAVKISSVFLRHNQIELDYGNKLGTYQAKIALSSTQQVEAEVLYLGRLVLLARSLDGEQFWNWDAKQQSWQALPDANKNDLNTAYQLAQQQIAPTLLNLPVSLTAAEAK